jgi:cobalt-zinc-cadmium efflux system outer membrane protein
MGRNEFPDIVLSDLLSQVRAFNMPSIDAILQLRPEMEAARRGIEQARANRRLQEAMAKPDPEVSFGYKRTEGLNTLIGIVTLPLPFRNRNQGAVASAGAGISVSEAYLRATEAQVRAEVESARAHTRAASECWQRFFSRCVTAPMKSPGFPRRPIAKGD